MQFLILTIIIAVTNSVFLASVHLTPAPLKFFPEALSVLVIAYVIVTGALDRFRMVAGRYWLLFGAFALVVLCGVLASSPAPGVLIGNGRYYLRAVPMFFIPALVHFSEAQVRAQLRLLLAIALVQLPLSLYQRYTVYSDFKVSGDTVIGTLMNSATLSIFLISVICIALAMTLRKRLSRPTFVGLFVLLVLPTTINETKATLFLLPIGILTTLLVGSPPGKRLRVGLSAVGLIAVFGALFIPIYDYFSVTNNQYPYTIESFFTNRKLVEYYLDPGTDVGSRKGAGRIDSLVVPLQTFASDPVHLMFGVGIGNGSISTFGNGYTGEYEGLLGRYTAVSSGAAFLVEVGLLGLALALALDWLVLRDAIFLAHRDHSIIGALALGWVGTTVVMVIATFYKDLHTYDSLSYLFWYFSGLVAAERMRLRPAAPVGNLSFHRPQSDSHRKADRLRPHA